MTALQGMVALVTGASRGVGRGIAVALGEAGATVFLTARTLEPGASPFPGSLAETAAELTGCGGIAIPLVCDHRDDDQVRAVLRRIEESRGRLDLLVNNAMAMPAGEPWATPFWEQPIALWDDLHTVGLRSHYVASALAVPLLTKGAGKLIVSLSSGAAESFSLNVAYGVSKAGVERLAADMAHDLRPLGITSVALRPGAVSTERALLTRPPTDLAAAWETPRRSGRAIVALLRDADRFRLTGRSLSTAQLAEEDGSEDLVARGSPARTEQRLAEAVRVSSAGALRLVEVRRGADEARLELATNEGPLAVRAWRSNHAQRRFFRQVEELRFAYEGSTPTPAILGLLERTIDGVAGQVAEVLDAPQR